MVPAESTEKKASSWGEAQFLVEQGMDLGHEGQPLIGRKQKKEKSGISGVQEDREG